MGTSRVWSREALRYLLSFLVVLLLPHIATAQTSWDEVAKAHHVQGWKDVNVITFTFKHHNGKVRRHEWWVKKHTVRVTVDGVTTVIPVNVKDLKGEAQIAAHKFFINDAYWLLFEHHVGWDDVKVEDLGEVPSPFGAKAQAFRISYPPTGGYTPGDAYVAYIGQDHRVMGWSYYLAGAKEPKLTTTRADYQQFGPLVLPTRFETLDGKVYLEFVDVSVR